MGMRKRRRIWEEEVGVEEEREEGRKGEEKEEGDGIWKEEEIGVKEEVEDGGWSSS